MDDYRQDVTHFLDCMWRRIVEIFQAPYVLKAVYWKSVWGSIAEFRTISISLHGSTDQYEHISYVYVTMRHDDFDRNRWLLKFGAGIHTTRSQIFHSIPAWEKQPLVVPALALCLPIWLPFTNGMAYYSNATLCGRLRCSNTDSNTGVNLLLIGHGYRFISTRHTM